VDLSLKASVHLSWSNYFAKKLLHKLNIFEVNCLCQHGLVDEDDEEPPQLDDDEHPIPP